MENLEVAVDFLKTTSHLKEIGSAIAFCGIPVAGWFIRKFFFITQVGCKECRNKLKERR